MITVKICESEQQYYNAKDIDEQWINQQINRRIACGEVVWLWIKIQQGNLNFSISTPNYPVGGFGGGRQLIQDELHVYQLWKERGLENPDFTGGNLIAFLKQFFREF